MSDDERTPLLQDQGPSGGPSADDFGGDHHAQFCHLVGTQPRDLPPGQTHDPHPESLYYRAVTTRDRQNNMYLFTSSLSNTLILAQVVLGATLTGLGASDSSPILVTIFGATNTIIAGLIAFLKSRGQPLRARAFRDDLGRVVDEIENSSVMWLGISKGAHGYDAIDTDDQVTVRSEVARLTRLYDRAVKINSLNDPDMYSTGAPIDPHSAALKDKSTAGAVPVPGAPAVPNPAAAIEPAAPAPATAVSADPDDSPATKAPEPTKQTEPAKPSTEDKPKETAETATAKDAGPASDKGKASEAKPEGNAEGQSSSSAADEPTLARSPAATDPDESPATAVIPEKHTEDTSTNGDDKK